MMSAFRKTEFWLLLLWAAGLFVAGIVRADAIFDVFTVLVLAVMPAIAFYPRVYRFLFKSSSAVFLILVFCGLVFLWYVWLWFEGSVDFARLVFMGFPMYQLSLSFVAYRMFLGRLGREPKELLVDIFDSGLFWDRVFFMSVFLGCLLVPALLMGRL
jgi:hypothetical protein